MIKFKQPRICSGKRALEAEKHASAYRLPLASETSLLARSSPLEGQEREKNYVETAPSETQLAKLRRKTKEIKSKGNEGAEDEEMNEGNVAFSRRSGRN